MNNKFFSIVMVPILICSLVYAETVHLKSGKIIEGKIVEKTDNYIKLDISGVAVTFFNNEIERIDSEVRKVTPEESITKSADEQFKELVKASFGPESIFQKGITSLENKDIKKAIEYFDSMEFLGYNKSEWVLRQRGVVDNKEFLTALANYEQEIDKNPLKNAEMYYNLGRLYRFKAIFTPQVMILERDSKIIKGKEQTEEAIKKALEYFSKAIELNPQFADAYYFMGRIYTMQKDFPRAISSMEKAIQFNAEKFGSDIEFQYNLASLYCAVGKFKVAEGVYNAFNSKLDSSAGPLKRQINFEIKKIQLLNSIVISEELNRINIKDKAFDGIWDMRMDKVMRFEGPYMSENELRQQRAMVENAIEQYRHLGGVPLRMQIDQDGYFLKAMTETEQFTGICSGKWFVIGNCVFTKKGDHVIDRIHLLYGELKEDGRIEGKELSIFNDKPVERFPTFNAEIETHFVGKYVGSSLRF